MIRRADLPRNAPYGASGREAGLASGRAPMSGRALRWEHPWVSWGDQLLRSEREAHSVGAYVARPEGRFTPMPHDDEQGYPEPPAVGDEVATLLGSLERQRATLAWKCADLDAAGLRASVGASSVTLGGLLKHLAYMEDINFSRDLAGRDLPPPWNAVDWSTEKGWEWRSAFEDTPEELHALWGDAVARSRSAVTDALAEGGLDGLVGEDPPGKPYPYQVR